MGALALQFTIFRLTRPHPRARVGCCAAPCASAHASLIAMQLLCLDASTIHRAAGSAAGCPHPSQCDLYHVNRDTLFSYHRASERFLQRLVGLFVASHYKNSPNDLQLMADAPAHHIFVLLGPVDATASTLPEILCVVQVCLEGEISRESVMRSLSRGIRAAGDLIPWTVSQQFQDDDFARLSGARIVRIATHPDYQNVRAATAHFARPPAADGDRRAACGSQMGYGSRALQLLADYYSGFIPPLDPDAQVDDEEASFARARAEQDAIGTDLQSEHIVPRKQLPPLLRRLGERRPERLHYIGVSYGLTEALVRRVRSPPLPHHPGAIGGRAVGVNGVVTRAAGV